MEELSIQTDSVLKKEDLFSYLGSAYPSLTTLILKVCGKGIFQAFKQFPLRKLLELYKSCPSLITVYCLDESTFIRMDEHMRLNCRCFPFSSIEEKEIFLECVRLAVERSPCRPIVHYI